MNSISTEAGQAALNARNKIERTNHELANHHGLRKPRTRGHNKLSITGKLKGMAINVKLMVKNLGSVVKDPFIRYKRCLLYTSPSPRDGLLSRMPSSA